MSVSRTSLSSQVCTNYPASSSSSTVGVYCDKLKYPSAMTESSSLVSDACQKTGLLYMTGVTMPGCERLR